MFEKFGKIILLILFLSLAVLAVERGFKIASPYVAKVSPSLATFLAA